MAIRGVAVIGIIYIVTELTSWAHSYNSSCDINVASKSLEMFLSFGIKKHVEVLYLRVVVLDDLREPSFGEDISSIYDPLGWVWTNSEQGNAILSLPYDYNVLSCTTLSRDTRNMDFHIYSQPPNCFGKQSAEQQYRDLVDLLARTAGRLSVNSSVCHRFVEGQPKRSPVIYQSRCATGLPRIRYKCCRVSDHNYDCTNMVTPNPALSFILTALWLISCGAAFFTPLLVGCLPNTKAESIINLVDEDTPRPFELNNCAGDCYGDNTVTGTDDSVPGDVESGGIKEMKPSEDEYITLNSSTPLRNFLEINHCHVCPQLFPRLSRLVLFFIVIPAVAITALVTYSIVLKHDITLQKHADIKTDFIQMCLNPDPFMISRLAAYIFSCILLCIPTSLANVVDESVIFVGNLQVEESCCVVCAALQQTPNQELIGPQLLYYNMLTHLKSLFSVRFWKVLFALSSFPSRWLLHVFHYRKVLSVAQPWKMDEMVNYCISHPSCQGVIMTFFWLLFLPLWLIAFFCIASFVLFLMMPVGYFYACVCFVPLVFLVQNLGNNICTWLAFFVSFSVNILSALFLIEVITFSWSFILKLFGFTLMGLVVSIDYYIPYLVYILAVFYYIENFWKSLNDKYLKMKVLVFDACLKQHALLTEKQDCLQGLQLVIRHRKTELPMIPKKLYQNVCRQHIPIKKTVLSSLLNLLMILLFLSFAFASIMAFGKWAKLPSLTEAGVTAFLSTLPKLLRYTGKHTGSSMLKEKKLLHSIEVTVSQFARKQNNETTGDFR